MDCLFCRNRGLTCASFPGCDPCPPLCPIAPRNPDGGAALWVQETADWIRSLYDEFPLDAAQQALLEQRIFDLANQPEVLSDFEFYNQLAPILQEFGLQNAQIEALTSALDFTDDLDVKSNLQIQIANELAGLGYKVDALTLHQENLNTIIALPDNREKFVLWGQAIRDSSRIAYDIRRIRKTDLNFNLKTAEGLLELAERFPQ